MSERERDRQTERDRERERELAPAGLVAYCVFLLNREQGGVCRGSLGFPLHGIFLIRDERGRPARCFTVAILTSDQNDRQRRVDSRVTEEEGARRPLRLRILESDHADCEQVITGHKTPA